VFADVFSCDRRHNFMLSDTKEAAIKLTVVVNKLRHSESNNRIFNLFRLFLSFIEKC